MKKISPQTITGQRGINLIERKVLEMGWIWHQRGIDAGIDGHIEIRHEKTGEVTNLLIQVQSKATVIDNLAQGRDNFTYLCEEKDIDYWLKSNVPVILIFSNLPTEQAFWISIKDYFGVVSKRLSRRASFRIPEDIFDRTAMDKLAQLAVPLNSGIVFSPRAKVETLVSNLLEIASYPQTLFSAPTHVRDRGELRNYFRDHEWHPGNEWELNDKRIFSFIDIRGSKWSELCDTSKVTLSASTDTANSENEDERWLFTKLLYKCVDAMLRRRGVRYDKNSKTHYFNATKDLSARKIIYHSTSKEVTREVFRPYMSKKNPSEVSYYRHSAFQGKFTRVNNVWYLKVTPTYRFTLDGESEHPFSDRLLNGIKKLELNEALLGQLLMWEDFLSQPSSLFREDYAFLSFANLQRYEIPVGINDPFWLANDEDTEFEIGIGISNLDNLFDT